MNFINTFIDVLKNKYATFSGEGKTCRVLAVYCSVLRYLHHSFDY